MLYHPKEKSLLLSFNIMSLCKEKGDCNIWKIKAILINYSGHQ